MFGEKNELCGKCMQAVSHNGGKNAKHNIYRQNLQEKRLLNAAIFKNLNEARQIRMDFKKSKWVKS